MNQKFNIGCSSNDKYAQHMGVMIYSLLANCKNPEKIKIFVVDGGISEDNKNKIKKVTSKFKAELKFLSPEIDLTGIRVYKHFGIETYYRFFLFDKCNFEKILYLDSDLIVEGDISEIFKIDFAENIIFAVKDPGAYEDKKRLLDIPVKNLYFNAGVLYVDCNKWKKEKISEKSIGYMKKNPDRIEYADQDALNHILIEKWKELDPSWNVITRVYYKKYLPWMKISDYKKEELDLVAKNPKILHFAGIVKPWFLLDRHSKKGRYIFYLQKTPWRNYKFPDSNLKGFLRRLKDYFNFIFEKINYWIKSRKIK